MEVINQDRVSREQEREQEEVKRRQEREEFESRIGRLTHSARNPLNKVCQVFTSPKTV
jgi:hypothetical protein